MHLLLYCFIFIDRAKGFRVIGVDVKSDERNVFFPFLVPTATAKVTTPFPTTPGISMYPLFHYFYFFVIIIVLCAFITMCCW